MFTPKPIQIRKRVKKHKNSKYEVLTARKRRHNKAVTHEGCLAAPRRWRAAPRPGQAVASDMRCSSVQSWFFPGFTISHGCSKPNQPNRKTANQTNPNQNSKKPHLVRMNSDDFCTEPRGLVRFAVCISATEPNQTKPQE
ncbi:hypothetical protein MTR_3g020700 [Medicago truncatula]|uniref:Uncharacterized protein n=1 Tax=Medicago truncatula TaxID=3880 RepID=G7IW77_MEDTR|nr:hypothetical protein MTR_3g020700 [Medicago truncatula]